MTRTTRRTIPTALAVLGMSVVLGACQQGAPGGDATPTDATSPTATTSPSPSPSPSESKTPEEQATELAEQAVRDYYETSDAALQDPEGFKQEDLKDVASTTALADLQNLLAASRDQELTQIGTTEIVEVKATKVDLTNKPKANPPELPYVEFRVCYDVSDLNVVDKDGKSVVPADRPDKGVQRVGVVNYDYPDTDGWKVDYTEQEDGKC
ncbi:hypothetical protein [Isoptericola sp. NPDC056578]|uniref:hypothetical protein n=1 Tax=unclassified Isoptericola TaxID=2623355 RepID=UPI0036C61535